MTTFTWTISAMDCKVNENNLTNVVQTIHWRYNAVDAYGNTAETYGAQSMTSPDPDAFTAYEDITLETVVGWLEEIMDVEAMQASLEAQIELQKTPVTVTLPLFSQIVTTEVEPKV